MVSASALADGLTRRASIAKVAESHGPMLTAGISSAPAGSLNIRPAMACISFRGAGCSPGTGDAVVELRHNKQKGESLSEEDDRMTDSSFIALTQGALPAQMMIPH